VDFDQFPVPCDVAPPQPFGITEGTFLLLAVAALALHAQTGLQRVQLQLLVLLVPSAVAVPRLERWQGGLRRAAVPLFPKPVIVIFHSYSWESL